jgi:predicted double-glycine peptidase
MNPWLEIIAVTLVALSGIALGKISSGFKKSYWVLGYFIPLGLIAILVTARIDNTLLFVPPFSLIAASRLKFAVLSFAVMMGLTTPFSRIPYKSEKLIICVFMIVFTVWFSILPFLAPVVLKNQLSNIRTKTDLNGICYQSKAYTCGPAAAVTALRRLGLPAEEGEIAILSHTSPVIGTLPWCLYKALQNRYGADGLKCQYRRFDSASQLRNAGIILVVVKDAFLRDHCVAIIGVSDHTVTIADPVLGKQSMSYGEFEKIWRFSGITLERDSVQNI